MSRVIITTVSNLRDWVCGHMDCYAKDEEIYLVTETIQTMNHPAWGTDWSEFLDEIDLDELY